MTFMAFKQEMLRLLNTSHTDDHEEASLPGDFTLANTEPAVWERLNRQRPS